MGPDGSRNVRDEPGRCAGTRRVASELVLDRIRAIAGEAAAECRPHPDVTNPRHVDRLARSLLARFHEHDDGEAFTLLIELTHEPLLDACEHIAREVGLVADLHELVASLFSRVFVDTWATRSGGSFLERATTELRREAEAWVRDLALRDVPEVRAHGGVAAGDPAGGEPNPRRAVDVGEFDTELVQTCFHRLDGRYRRVLRASEVEGLSDRQIAAAFVMDSRRVRRLIQEAQRRLRLAIARALSS